MQRGRTLWPLAAAGMSAGLAAVGIGTALGGELGLMAAGYGLLVVLAAAYLAVGLAIRDRVWRRLSVARASRSLSAPLQGRRAS